MKKVFLSLAMVAALTVVSCKETKTEENTEVTAPAEETAAPVEETTAPATTDTTATATETTTTTTETAPATEAAPAK